jgi:bisphosphoglycerate-independent phosphoglycerate mutase (AlkP superfamily)
VRAGRGVASEITNLGWRKHLDPDAPLVTPADAGRILAGISAEVEVTLFAHYDTDHVGHRKDIDAAVGVLERVDSFLGGLLPALPADALLVIASDHGNVEDATVGHTTNPVPVIAFGPGSEALARRVRSIADVTPAILELLGIDRGPIE